MPRKVAPLTDTKCRSAKPPQSGALKLFDGDGLFLQVTPAGSKLWRLKYRYAGKEKLLALGAYPEVSLVAARDARSEARKLLAAGRDPSIQRKVDRAAAMKSSEDTLEAAARAWHRAQSGAWTPKNAAKVLGRLEKHIFPWLGSLPIAEVTAPMLVSVLRRVEDQGVLDTARRLRHYLKRIGDFAVTQGMTPYNVAASLAGVTATPLAKNYASIRDPKLLSRLLQDIAVYEGSMVTRTALALAPMLFCRPGELRGMEWSELDLDRKEWKVPPRRQKLKLQKKESNRTPDFIVPLPRQALALLEELRPLTGRGRFVFPSERSPDRSMSDGTINAALRRMGYTKSQITGHGFRHTASTMLNEQRKWSDDAIEAQLSHKDHSVRGVYNAALYLDERRAMMQSWADYLDELKRSPGGAGKEQGKPKVTS